MKGQVDTNIMSPLGTQNLTKNSTLSNFPPAICANDNKLGVSNLNYKYSTL